MHFAFSPGCDRINDKSNECSRFIGEAGKKADVYSFKFPHESIIEKSMDVPGSRFIGEAGKKADVYSFEVPYE